MDKDRYPKYMKSPEWQRKRKEKLKEANYQCEKCGTAKQLHVHHINYDHLGFESMDEIVVLCEKCHKNVHTYDMKQVPKKDTAQRKIMENVYKAEKKDYVTTKGTPGGYNTYNTQKYPETKQPKKISKVKEQERKKRIEQERKKRIEQERKKRIEQERQRKAKQNKKILIVSIGIIFVVFILYSLLPIVPQINPNNITVGKLADSGEEFNAAIKNCEEEVRFEMHDSAGDYYQKIIGMENNLCAVEYMYYKPTGASYDCHFKIFSQDGKKLEYSYYADNGVNCGNEDWFARNNIKLVTAPTFDNAPIEQTGGIDSQPVDEVTKDPNNIITYKSSELNISFDVPETAVFYCPIDDYGKYHWCKITENKNNLIVFIAPHGYDSVLQTNGIGENFWQAIEDCNLPIFNGINLNGYKLPNTWPPNPALSCWPTTSNESIALKGSKMWYTIGIEKNVTMDEIAKNFFDRIALSLKEI
jgi:hypothetical protein